MASAIIKPSEGSTELADVLFEMGMGDDVVLTPDQELPDTIGGKDDYPIYVTLPPTQLTEFFENLSRSYKDKNENFIFFSGGPKYGNIEDVLKGKGTYCSVQSGSLNCKGFYHLTFFSSINK